MADEKKILVIDSDVICFTILKFNFLNQGLFPLWVHITNALDAIHYLEQYKMPDLIFLEPVLPGIHYEEMFQVLESLHVFSKTKVCLLTTYTEPELNTVGSEYTILKRISKPFLSRHVKELLQHSILA